MKSWILAAAMTLGAGTACLADGQYWVVGSRASNKCEIVPAIRSFIRTVTMVHSGSGPVPTNPSPTPNWRVPPSANAQIAV